MNDWFNLLAVHQNQYLLAQGCADLVSPTLLERIYQRISSIHSLIWSSGDMSTIVLSIQSTTPNKASTSSNPDHQSPHP